MHVLSEGVVPLELKLLLRELMRKGYFDLDFLNSRVQSFTYGKKEDITVDSLVRVLSH